MPLNNDVTRFLDELHHPLRQEIEALRLIILQANALLEENIKWNGPNYSIGPEDRVTMRIQPPKQIQLVFHRGAKVKEQPKGRLIQDASGLLVWRENDRAIASFKHMEAVKAGEQALAAIVRNWIAATV
ncbi:hypothetical protein GCM10007423_20030 [Dyadobacter endophyticus]|uniref:YdhG-like domain-containing protein n=1 Tax=Dyadobacter endophyticus TaxID=1749036 RepID=A0ABQ1YNK9_9BACT|nr:DUF1801 domain-containing protein [Dyadobacter endophyticus]GGH31277.1 hypothetical protein GCM10007423_20030 [Dyadobacter endophyticus]